MIRLAAVVVLLLLATPGRAAAETFDHQHTAWTEILRQHVRNDGAVSHVDYAALRADRSALDAYLGRLSRVSRDEFDAWTGPRQLAFLINAYNAFTVQLIIEHYPVESIKDLGGWFSSPWKKRFFRLLGDERHLDDVEHGMIRRDFDEPRIHFAVNCAALGCPPLRAEAYVATRLDAQLEDNTRVFLRDVRRNRYRAHDRVLELSELLDWYEGDFATDDQSLESFVASRITDAPTIADAVRSRATRVRFLDYDWALNDK